jgi:hypothetical protein
MKFGNWAVTGSGIEWQPNPELLVVNDYQLLETTDDSSEKGIMYKWILFVTEEEWLTDDDLYDFNFAFVYAAAKSSGAFEYDIFDRTVAYQFELLDEDDSPDAM